MTYEIKLSLAKLFLPVLHIINLTIFCYIYVFSSFPSMYFACVLRTFKTSKLIKKMFPEVNRCIWLMQSHSCMCSGPLDEEDCVKRAVVYINSVWCNSTYHNLRRKRETRRDDTRSVLFVMTSWLSNPPLRGLCIFNTHIFEFELNFILINGVFGLARKCSVFS